MGRAAGGDVDAWGALLAQHQDRLQRVASFRLDSRLRGRIDAADGEASFGEFTGASLWSGTAASWVDLHPAGAMHSHALGIHNGQ